MAGSTNKIFWKQTSSWFLSRACFNLISICRILLLFLYLICFHQHIVLTFLLFDNLLSFHHFIIFRKLPLSWGFIKGYVVGSPRAHCLFIMIILILWSSPFFQGLSYVELISLSCFMHIIDFILKRHSIDVFTTLVLLLISPLC